jgi:hypothetical protein
VHTDNTPRVIGPFQINAPYNWLILCRIASFLALKAHWKRKVECIVTGALASEFRTTAVSGGRANSNSQTYLTSSGTSSASFSTNMPTNKRMESADSRKHQLAAPKDPKHSPDAKPTIGTKTATNNHIL